MFYDPIHHLMLFSFDFQWFPAIACQHRRELVWETKEKKIERSSIKEQRHNQQTANVPFKILFSPCEVRRS